MAWFDIILPEYKHVTDYVTFDSKSSNKSLYFKKGKDGITNHKNSACYSVIMENLKEIEVICYPNYNKESPISFELFSDWINLCKKHGIVDESSEIYHEDKSNILKMPFKKRSRHLAYATLCCYRWADSLPKMVHLIVELMKIGDRNFYQVLHYGLLKNCTNTGHSFVDIGTYGYQRLNLGLSIAMSMFFTRKNGIAIADNYKEASATNAAISSFYNEKGLNSCPVFSKDFDILRKEWTPYYSRPDLKKKNIDHLLKRYKKFMEDKNGSLGKRVVKS